MLKIILLLSLTLSAFSQNEFGLGPIVIRSQDYRGSDQYHNHILPIPYFSYTTKTTEAESSFLRQLLFAFSIFEVKLGISAGLSVDSSKNDARSGMPNLDYTFELGPLFVMNFYKGKNLHFNLNTSARRTFYTNLENRLGVYGTYGVSYLLLSYEYESFYWETTAALTWGSKGFHDYYYQVEKRFATADRPEYESRAGYSGWHWTSLVKFKLWQLRFLSFVRMDDLKNVAFHESPLFKRERYWMFGSGIFFIF